MILRLNIVSLTRHAAADLNNLESCAHQKPGPSNVYESQDDCTAVQKSKYDSVTRVTKSSLSDALSSVGHYSR